VSRCGDRGTDSGHMWRSPAPFLPTWLIWPRPTWACVAASRGSLPTLMVSRSGFFGFRSAGRPSSYSRRSTAGLSRRGRRYHEHGLTSAREIGRRHLELSILNDLGFNSINSDDLDMASSWFDEAARLAEQLHDDFQLAPSRRRECRRAELRLPGARSTRWQIRCRVPCCGAGGGGRTRSRSVGARSGQRPRWRTRCCRGRTRSHRGSVRGS